MYKLCKKLGKDASLRTQSGWASIDVEGYQSTLDTRAWGFAPKDCAYLYILGDEQ